MLQRIMRWLRCDRPVYPFRPTIQAMRQKDPVLYAEVGPMPPSVAVQRWREVYPEDFVGVYRDSPYWDVMNNPSVINQPDRRV